MSFQLLDLDEANGTFLSIVFGQTEMFYVNMFLQFPWCSKCFPTDVACLGTPLEFHVVMLCLHVSNQAGAVLEIFVAYLTLVRFRLTPFDLFGGNLNTRFVALVYVVVLPKNLVVFVISKYYFDNAFLTITLGCHFGSEKETCFFFTTERNLKISQKIS